MTTLLVRSRRALVLLWLSFILPLAGLAQVPVITTGPTNQSAVSGASVVFSVVGSGLGPLSYQWRLAGTNLVAQTNGSLTVSNIIPRLGGLYSVVVTNIAGAVTSSPALLAVDEHLTFRILQLQTNGVIALEHSTVTGDDRGGIVTSPDFVFVTGDNATARFSASDLSGGTSLGRIYDGMAGNLRDEKIYLLANGNNLIVNGGGTINSLLEMDPDTGLPNGTRINLSTNITMTSGVIFSGYDRIVLWNNSAAFDIALPSGLVRSLGSVPNLQRQFSESWLSWGVVEYFGNTLSLVYVQNSTQIVRLQVGANTAATPVQEFSNLSDMANIGISLSRSRWYFHHEGTSQFRSGDETVGSAKALFTTNAGFPVIYQSPLSQTAYPGDTVTLSVLVSGTAPFTYQWRVNGTNIGGATEATLVLANVEPSSTGLYSVEVANAAGSSRSEEGSVFVVGAPQILLDPPPRSVVPGTNTTFSILMQAAPPVYFQWQQNGTNLPNATNATYEIPFVTSTDVGLYNVVVSNRFGTATSASAPLALVIESAFSFKILSLSNDAVVAEHLDITGSDYGGLALSSNHVFVTGDTACGMFSADDLSGGVSLPVLHRALVTDLRTEKVYSLGDGPNLFLTTTSSVVTTLIEIDGATGALTTNVISLSQPVPMNFNSGLFSGYGQIVLHNGSKAFRISLPSGVVSDLGAMTTPSHQASESWAYWGLTENFDGAIYLVYVQNPTSIVRTRVPDGATTTIANFLNLADMASIGASVTRGRWYFHHQGESQFGGTNETLGFCSAVYAVVANPVVDHFAWEPLPGAQFSGVPFAATVTARNIDDLVFTNYSGQVSFSGFTTFGGQPVAVMPTTSGNFMHGIWTGSVTVAQPTAGMYLRAGDLAGRFGVSTPFAVAATNDLAVQIIPSASSGTIYSALSYTVLLTNSGPQVSSGVFLTNLLPAGVNFISAAPSQGACVLNDAAVVCDLGTMNSGTSVSVLIAVVPQSLVTLTNVATVRRVEAETHSENNTATVMTTLALPTIVFNDSAVFEGDSAANRGTNVFTVQLNTTSAVPITVQFTTFPGTATNVGSVDYVNRSGTLTFAPGVTVTNIRVTLAVDRIYEQDEYFLINFSNAVNATLVRTQAVGLILNDDPQPDVTVTNALVTEGSAGNSLVNIPVRLSGPAGVPISLNYATANGSAIAGSDYTSQSGLLYFTNGATNLSLSISVTGDTVGESNEFFYVRFFNANPTNLSYSTQILVTIINDDPIGVDHFRFDPVGATQYLNSAIPVTITARDFADNLVSGFTNTVSLSGGGGGGNALLTIGTNSTTWFEPFYTFWHDSRTQVIYPAANLVGVQHIRSLALNVTELPGQPLNFWTIRMKHTTKNDYAVNTGFETAGWTVVYQANLTVSALGWITFTFPVPFDYNGVDNLMVDFSHNNTSYTTSGQVAATTGTALRTLFYNCDSCQGDPLLWSGGLPGNNTSQIVPDIRLATSGGGVKVAPTNSAIFVAGAWNGNVTVLEPGVNVRLQAMDAGSHFGQSDPFTVLLADDLALRLVPSSAPAALSENLAYSVIVSNAGPGVSTGVFLTNQLPANAAFISAVADHGVVTTPGSRVIASIGTLAAGESAVLNVVVRPNGVGSVTNSAVVRRNEAEVYLANNTVTNVTAVVALALSVAPVAVREGDTGVTNALFVVSLSAASTQAVSVAFATSNSTATAGTDYQARSGMLIFPPGTTNQVVAVPVFGDRMNEGNEVFLLTLTNATNAIIVSGSAAGTIVNDDVLPMISIGDVSVAEGRNGLTAAIFTLGLSEASGQFVTLYANTSDGTASGASDYVPTNIFIFFEPGQTTAQATVLVRADGVLEADETFLLNLYGVFNATFADVEARATILNDDNPAGVFDHFEWEPLPSPQTVQRGISVTLTARDSLGGLIPFNGTVGLTAPMGTNTLLLAPTVTTPFVNGVWNGVLTLLESGTNVVLLADDGAGHIGASNPFDVNLANLALTGGGPPQVLIASPFTYTFVLTNLGPGPATSVMLTNSLPADAAFVSASSPAGACTYLDGVVRCEVGTIPSGGTVTLNIRMNPLRGGFLTNITRVAAFEFDPLSGNNSVTNIAQINGDEDHDGLPDAWEADYGLSSSNPNDAALDLDGDGHTSLQEYIAGTDPSSAASVLKATLDLQAGLAQIRFTTALNHRYALERAGNPAGPWLPLGSIIIGDGDVAVVPDPEPLTQAPRFYRLQALR